MIGMDREKESGKSVLSERLDVYEGLGWLVGWLGFYGISTFVGYLMPNPFLCS